MHIRHAMVAKIGLTLPLAVLMSSCGINTRTSDSQIAALTAKAERACLYERRGGAKGKPACWASFEKAIAGKKASESDTACDPIWTTGRSWSEGDDNKWVTTYYHAAVSKPPEVILCTPGEAKTFEDAMMAGSLDDPETIRRADKIARDLVAGRSVAATSGKPLCS
ncbi:MAG: hypothetical protein V4564_20300 [Pseudomonadota bacterium]